MKVVLSIAMSLDGYIADKDGAVNWLYKYSKKGEDNGYKDFYDTVDTLIMGAKTYQQIQGFGLGWVYPGKKCLVFTHKKLESLSDDIEFVSGEPIEWVKKMKKSGTKKIWIVGGGDIAHQMLKANLVDELILSIIPETLGGGIKLFKPEIQSEWKITSAKTYPTGVGELRYEAVWE